MSRVKQCTVGLVAAGALAFVGISLAAGGAPRVEATDFWSIQGASVNGATVKCPQGQHVLGGGEVQAGGPFNLYQLASAPTANGRGWFVALRNHDLSTNSQNVKTLAICTPKGTHRDFERFFVDPNDAEGQTLSCGPGERAVGGGIQPTEAGVHNFVLKANGPLNAGGNAATLDGGDKPVKWFSQIAYNPGGSPPPALVIQWVVCLPSSKARIKTAQFALDEGESSEAFVRCPKGRAAIGGGVMPVGQTRTMNVRASGPVSGDGTIEGTVDGTKAKQWYGAAQNFAGGENRIFKVIAICE